MMTIVMMIIIIVIHLIFISSNHSGAFDRGRSLANVAVAFLQPEIPGDGDDDGMSHDIYIMMSVCLFVCLSRKMITSLTGLSVWL